MALLTELLEDAIALVVGVDILGAVHGSIAETVSVKDGEAPEVTTQEALDEDVAGMALFNLGFINNLPLTSTIEVALSVGAYGITALPGHWLEGIVE